MRVHRLGEIGYEEGMKAMRHIHSLATHDGENHLILCSHPPLFTVGQDEKMAFDLPTVKTDRGGSITCHAPGQNIYYFCFQAKNPARFYAKVIESFKDFFADTLDTVHYDKKYPGFYIQNRKIASLGFRYSKGVSLHGLALNVDVDLDFCAQVPPCNLKGIIPTSLHNEGVKLSLEAVDNAVIASLERHYV